MLGDYRIIDLSVPLEHKAASEPLPARIRYIRHGGWGLWQMRLFFGVKPRDLVWSNGLGWAVEEVRAITHTGTHVDAPYHYGETAAGKPARTIDEVPLEWCFAPGVVLDVRSVPSGEEITVQGNGGSSDGTTFLSVLNPAGSDLLLSTRLGVNGVGQGQGVALGVFGDVYVGGEATPSVEPWPTTEGAFQPEFAGGHDGFVMRIRPSQAELRITSWKVAPQALRARGGKVNLQAKVASSTRIASVTARITRVDTAAQMVRLRNEFAVYGRTGEECIACGRAIRCVRIAGRSTHFCGRCQK